jgi:hypothetical protein
MRKENYFVGVRFNKDKQLFNKLNENSLSNSELIRKSLRQYFITKEDNRTFNVNSYNQDLVGSMNKQIDFLQNELSFLHKQNAYLSLPWYKKVVYQLEEKSK